MLNLLKSFFTEKMELPQVSAAAPQAPQPQEDKTIQIATCAILLEAALADNELSREEIEHIHTALSHLYDMDTADVEKLIEITREEGKNAIDLWQFTNLINKHYNLEQKILLMEHIWKVILSDGTLDKFEDYLARKLKPLLRLDHKQWIDAKIRARQHLSVKEKT